MARVDSLGHFLTDVADAIREKQGTSETIQASDFDTEIENISVSSGGKVAPKTVSFKNDTSETIDVSMLDTSKLSTMSNMFYHCEQVIELDTSGFNTSNVTNMERMFEGCYKVSSFNVSSFNTSNVLYMRYMFANCSIAELDLSNFITNSVTNMEAMFYNCTQLNKLDIRNFTFDSVTTHNSIFLNVPRNCEIIVKSDTEKTWVLGRRSDLTNVKTVAEYEAEQSE